MLIQSLTYKIPGLLLFSFLLISPVFDIKNNGYIFEILFLLACFFSLLILKNKKTIISNFFMFSSICLVLLFVVFLFSHIGQDNRQYSYFILDWLKVSAVAIYFFLVTTYAQKAIAFFIKLSIFYVLLDVFYFLFFHGFEGRYAGINLTYNLNSSVIMILFIVIIEYYLYRGKIDILLSKAIFIVGLILLYKMYLSESLIFSVIYLMVNSRARKTTSVQILAVTTVLIIAYAYIYTNIGSVMNAIDMDSSFNTRQSIYFYFLGALSFFPHGIEADNMILYTYFNGYPMHNDLIKYTYNYGFLYICFLFYVMSYVANKCNFKMDQLLLMIALFSMASLHNISQNFYILYPLIVLARLFSLKGFKPRAEH